MQKKLIPRVKLTKTVHIAGANIQFISGVHAKNIIDNMKEPL